MRKDKEKNKPDAKDAEPLILMLKNQNYRFLFTRATRQSPCLRETLATAAIT